MGKTAPQAGGEIRGFPRSVWRTNRGGNGCRRRGIASIGLSRSFVSPSACLRGRISDRTGCSPLDADLEELNGVSFDKGCYVGQELTARMKHRGTARKKLLPVESSAPSLPEAGTPITAAGSEIGAIT